MKVKDGLVKQDLTIADSTGTGRLTLWQDDTNKLNINNSYNLKSLMVR